MSSITTEPDGVKPPKDRSRTTTAAHVAAASRTLGRQVFAVPLHPAVLPRVRHYGSLPHPVHGLHLDAGLGPHPWNGNLCRTAAVLVGPSRPELLEGTAQHLLDLPVVVCAPGHRRDADCRDARPEFARQDLLENGRAAALRGGTHRRGVDLLQHVRRPARTHQQPPSRPRSWPDPVAYERDSQPYGDRDDGELQMDRLQHPHLARGHAGRPSRPLRGGRGRRSRPACVASSL